MNTIKNLWRLYRIHQLIAGEVTGTPRELSRRLEISTRLVFQLVEQLKDFNARVNYDRRRKTYYYEEAFDLEIRIEVLVRDRNKTREYFKNKRFQWEQKQCS